MLDRIKLAPIALIPVLFLLVYTPAQAAAQDQATQAPNHPPLKITKAQAEKNSSLILELKLSQ